MKIKNSFLLLLSLFFLFSCAQESKTHLKFRFEINDTVSEYRIFFYTRVLDGFKGDSLPVVLTVMSPEGKKYHDTISFPLVKKGNVNNLEEVRSGVWRDLRWLYRDGAILPKKGLWVFSVTHLSPAKNLQNIKDFNIMLKQE